MTGADQTEPEVLSEIRGSLGVLTLNRPQAVNALTENMVRILLATLRSWAEDDRVAQVLIQGAGERGLCAGGDIVAIYRDIASGEPNAGAQTGRFWRTEYQLNALIDAYPKPYIAVMDGLVLGGGVGVSAHGSVRIVTERTRGGMPETTIGFVPDVGGTYLLSRAPGNSGIRAALTGAHLNAADLIYLGFADYYVPSEKVSELVRALETEPADAVVPRFAQSPGQAPLEADRELIDAAYGHRRVEQIVQALREAGSGDAEVIESKSPTAVKVALESVRRARELPDLEAVLEQEYRVGMHLAAAHDMREGIRAQVIDKDRTPHWLPATLSAVDDVEVQAYFSPRAQ